MAKYAGEQLVVTDGTTLLGADDKAGIAIIVETARYFVEHPEIPHAKLCFAVTPDEEVGAVLKILTLKNSALNMPTPLTVMN